MTIAYLVLPFLAVSFLTQVSMGYFPSGCLLFNQQVSILLTFLMGMNFVSVLPYTANPLCEITLMRSLMTVDIVALIKQIIQVFSY